MNLYELDEFSIWTGNIEEVSDKAPIPNGWTIIEPPEVPEGLMAQLRGMNWVLIEEIPESDLLRKQYEENQELIKDIIQYRKNYENGVVVIDEVAFSGSHEERQLIYEAVQFAREAGVTMFPVWKDFNGKYHYNVTLGFIEDALMTVAMRRSFLITKESELVSHVMDGTFESNMFEEFNFEIPEVSEE